ncbi:hypothetical protein N7488_006478 [Penicillium malachiteum]|nr:hypothetical protein N7488_006478 [Penicillium malachiteum]
MSALTDYPDPIRRDGFESSHGKFRTQFGDILPLRPEQFQTLFLPRPIPAGKKALKVTNFVRAQLRYYGVEFDESAIYGDGFELLKTTIEAGKFNEIPSHIRKLEADMHDEWINKCTVEQLSSTPQWLLQKYFMSNGLPDRTKTKTVVTVLYPKRSRRLPALLHSLAGAIPGLQAKDLPSIFNKVIFLAWDLAAAEEALEKYRQDEWAIYLNEDSDQESNGDKKQHKAHDDYLDSLGQKKTGFTPVGSYIFKIEPLKSLMRDKEEAFMEIYETDTPGLYQADFDFGIMNGIMMMSSDKGALEEFGGEVSSGDSSGDELDSTIPANQVSWSSKGKEKKKRSEKGARQGQKQKKASEHHPLRYFFKHRCCEEHESAAFFIPRPGHVQFDDGRFCTFTGQILLPLSDKEISFTGYKISDKPPPTRYDWDDFGKEEGPVAEPSSSFEVAFLAGQTMI